MTALRPFLALFIVGGLNVDAVAAGSSDLEVLEHVWHRCVQEAYVRQSPRQSQAGAQRNALDECREYEDRLVAATLIEHARQDEADRRADRALTIRVGVWAATAAAYVVDPFTSWWQNRQR